ncbi:MAG: hypothetical protein EOP85_12815, partial [Verrucomicrobiaceae bacterium]
MSGGLFSVVTRSDAGINLKNGNFYISYTDIVSPSYNPPQLRGRLEITRTYNSKSVTASEFGFGWGWYFATSLRIDNEGGVFFKEHGSGDTRMGSGLSRFATQERALEMTLIRYSIPSLPRRSDYTPRFEALVRTQQTRLSATAQNLDSGLEFPVHPSVGWRQEMPGSSVVRTPDGYERRKPDGEREVFDLNGKLLMKRQANGYFIRIIYNS